MNLTPADDGPTSTAITSPLVGPDRAGLPAGSFHRRAYQRSSLSLGGHT